MRRKQTTRSALITSCISLLLCVSMLVGTTFAWFTDEVVSGNNQILAGNLDVDVYYGDPADENSITGVKTLFKDVELWEPGAMAWEQLTIINLGTLALKYNMSVSFNNGTDNGNGETLADILQVAILNEEPTRENIKNAQLIPMKEFSLGLGNEKLLSKESKSFYMAIYWEPSDRDNEFNMNNGNKGKELSIDLGIHLFATQLPKEEDSFDKYYDETAAVFTVKEANELLQQNKDVNLVNCDEPNGILYVPANYTGTLVLNNVKIASVQEMAAATTMMAAAEEEVTAPAGGKIVVLGDVVVKATEEGMSAITGTNLNITGDGNLTAIGKGKDAFGIGGLTTKSVKISGITIDYAEGGFAYEVGTDPKYYKDAPEGGAAIGSGFNGAEITLENVTVKKAVGGSKAAGIGARYHVGVTVNITDSTIEYVEGGVSAAGIGSSRVSNGAAENGTTINIKGSTVTAKGGAYGAGIGSGYDTHCQAKQPLCTINIENSVINATGGKYAAGVGTGYHNAALAGEIKGSTVKAVSGEKFYKAEYTAAMDIGFGVVDPKREGQQTDSKLTYNGKDIVTGPVAQIGSNIYYNMKTALENWTANSTLTLLSDVTLDDVIKLKSTEHHILNLSTYTLTAAAKQNAIEITPEGAGRAAKACLTVNADATNPGGITATGKACIYYRKTNGIDDRLMVTINGGVFNGSNAISSYSNNGGQPCPYYVINGGTFNGNVNLTKAMLKVTGGTFHKMFSCTGDSTAYRLICGGTFKSFTFMTADKPDKFVIGTAKGVYDVGVYVNADGYLVVGGPVITEAGDRFETEPKSYSSWSSYLKYSSAAANGLYYEKAAN